MSKQRSAEKRKMFQYDMYSTNINEIKVLKLSGHTSLRIKNHSSAGFFKWKFIHDHNIWGFFQNVQMLL